MIFFVGQLTEWLILMLNMGERGIGHLGAQTPLKHLYPAVNQRVTALPTCWNYKDKNQSIALVPNQLTVQYKGELNEIYLNFYHPSLW